MVNKVFKGWTKNRADLNFTPKTFNEMWREKVLSGVEGSGDKR
jgi:L-lactate dehydrogenase complex protein LldF